MFKNFKATFLCKLWLGHVLQAMLYWPRPIILTYVGRSVTLGINRSASNLTTRINTANEAELRHEQLSCDVNLFKDYQNIKVAMVLHTIKK